MLPFSAGSGLSGNSVEGRQVDLWALLGALPVPVAVHDLSAQERILFVNPSFTKDFGYALEDAPSLSAWAELACPDTGYRNEAMARWRDEIDARLAGGDIRPAGEYRIIDRAGMCRDVLIGFALQDDLAIVTFQDLTQTREAEAVLARERRENERTAFALTENMPAGAYTMVLRPGAEMAEFSFLSRQFLQMLDMKREEAEGDAMRAFARVHPEDRPEWIEMNAAAFAERRSFAGETRIIANGETRWVRAESVPRSLEDGSVIWEGVLVDIHALKTAEQELQTVLEAARAYTWRRDIRAQCSEFDLRWRVMAGPPHAEQAIPSENWLRTVHAHDLSTVRAQVAALESGSVERQILTYRRRIRGDEWIWLQVHVGVSERDAEGKPTALSGVSFDISEEMEARLKAQEDQAQLREDLQRAQQRDTVAQVAGGVALDLNNLIAIVSGTAELLEQRSGNTPCLKEGLGRIQRSIGMARELVAGLGGLVRPSTQRRTHELGKLLRDAVDLLGQGRITRHAVRLELHEPDMQIWANPTELAQVVVNLAINACDSGTQDMPATVTLAALPRSSMPPARPPDAGIAPPLGQSLALFTISDTGTGITPEVRERMFRPNFSTKGPEGTGLGLPIVSRILQSNGGGLWIESTLGEGTRMTVAWPMEAPAQDGRMTAPPGPEAAMITAPPTDALEGLRVLVVDDLVDVAEVLAGMLEAAGALTAVASDPTEAAEALSEAPGLWSVLVTDLHMPRMDGRALAQHAAGLPQPVPAVLVTARPDILTEDAARDFSAVLSKPVAASELVAAVRVATDRERSAGPEHRGDAPKDRTV